MRPLPFSRSKPTAAGLDVEEIARFRAWLIATGYGTSTAALWSARVRNAYAHGVEDPAAVNAAYPHLRQPSRAGLRAALLRYREFRGIA